MARTDRQQRRQRRAEKAGIPPLQPARKPQPVEPVREVAMSSADGTVEQRPSEATQGGFGPFRFIREAIAELKKVEWPGQQAVVSGTAVVLVACLLVGVYLYANDRLWAYFVQHVLVR